MSPREKFQCLLRELFQFESADLDFGIHRIMNRKRDLLERFIETDLLDAVEDILGTGGLKTEAGLAKLLAEKRAEVVRAFGEDAFDGEGRLVKGGDLPMGREYAELYEVAAEAMPQAVSENIVFNHLYQFFSRYYDKGDFLSLRRYSKDGKFAIPYNGEEVHLHWANKDQYYVKSGEYFTDYRWTAPMAGAPRGQATVHFKLTDARIDKDNIKAPEKRYFLPQHDEAAWDADTATLTLPVHYRGLTADEEEAHPGNGVQVAILAQAAEALAAAGALAKIPALRTALFAPQPMPDGSPKLDADGNPVPRLAHHLRRYASRNNSDFFVHKDLEGFLTRELDWYLKNEVLDLASLEIGGPARAPGWFQLMHAIRTLGHRIIAFLSQIENFQKKLFEKRKFVTACHYAVTLDRVPHSLYPEIARNDAQRAEWVALHHIDEIRKSPSQPAYSSPLTVDFLKSQPHLMVDTRHFPEEFKDTLLAAIPNLDAQTDGTLLHCENFQGLNLIQERFRGEVKCVYIDPPYNTSETSIIYKNEYRHSTWMSMVMQGVIKSRDFLNFRSVLAATIDDFENTNLIQGLDAVFDSANRLGSLVVEIKPSGRTNDRFLATSHEYVHFYGLSDKGAEICFFPLSEDAVSQYALKDEAGSYKWRDFLRTGGFSTPEERPNSYYPIFFNPFTKRADIEAFKDAIEILPVDSKGKARVWRKTKPSFMRHFAEGEIRFEKRKDGTWKVLLIDRIKDGVRPRTVWTGSRYDAASHGTKLLSSLFGDAIFGFPKSIHAVRDVLFCVCGNEEDAVVLDYFAGSGTTAHAVINLNREDGGGRKYMLIEMGRHFETVLLPRIKKVVYSPDWKGGKPVVRDAGMGHCVKILELESYEDALGNIGFDVDEDARQAMMGLDGYAMKYLLDFETRESPTLLNLERLEKPFDYTLDIFDGERMVTKKADLAETFAYLIGLKVETRRVHWRGGGKSRAKVLIQTGRTRDGDEPTAVVWRDIEGWGEREFSAERDWFAKEKLLDGIDRVYVNGDSVLPNGQSLDPPFKRLLFAGMEA